MSKLEKLKRKDLVFGKQVVVRCKDVWNKSHFLDGMCATVDRPYFLDGRLSGVAIRVWVKPDVEQVCLVDFKNLRRVV